MPRAIRVLIILAILAMPLPLPAGAEDGQPPLEPVVAPPSAETGEMVDETPQLWFVELASPPAVEGTSLTTLKSEKDAFRSAAATAELRYSERFAFDVLWNGLSIQVNRSDVTVLYRMPGVQALYPVVAVSVPATSPLENPDLAAALSMTGADIAQNELGLTGAGVRVAVVDTGVDYDHPDLGGCFGQGCRVVTGWDFVGDTFNADPTSPRYNPNPVPDPYPDDCDGHGTHVAGIIGANGAVKGVAPGVTFGAYRVFGCEGSTTADIILAAMERAQADGMQVLNMSLGSSFSWPEYPTARASDRLVNKGMVVVASIGNSGANGLYSADAPGVGKKVIGVASFDSTFTDALSFIVNPSGRPIPYLPIQDAPVPPVSGTSGTFAEPDIAITPDAVATPNTIATPDLTSAAGASATPDVSATPDAAATSDTIATPELTSAADASATLDVSATPDAAVTSDTIATPDLTSAAGASATLDVSATPDAVATSDTTATPDLTSAADASTLPDVFATPDLAMTLVPDVPMSPDAPAVPEASATPELFITPDVAVLPGMVVAPDVAATPDVTITPDIEATPDVSPTPEPAVTADATATADTPLPSDAAITPDTSLTPDITVTPDVPAVPDVALISGIVATQDAVPTPSVSATPDVAATPSASDTPNDPATPDVLATSAAAVVPESAISPDAAAAPAEVVFVGRGCPAGMGVPPGGDPYLANPAGKVALMVRGTCTFNEKYQRAAAAGAGGVIIYNNAAGLFSGSGLAPVRNVFAIGISQADGLFIRALKPPVTITWTNTLVSAPNPTGGLISSFSAYGLAPDLSLKPDIGAPGGLIRSTYPLEKGGYATISGTSMSSPYVAGAVALLLQARPNTPSQAVRPILQNSADPHAWWGNPGLGFFDNVHRQGAGMLDIPGAVLSTVKIEPGALSLGESEAGPAVRTLMIENDGPTDLTFDLTHVPALSTGPNTFSPSFLTGFASVSFSTRSVTVPAGGTSSVDVTLSANPTLPDYSLYGGYIVLTPQGAGQVYRVPYAGFKGDYQSIQVLKPTSNGFPWLAKLTGTNFVNQPSGATYTLQSGDLPYILVHLDHPARRLRLEVFALNTKAWHRALELQYVGRNSTSTSFFAFPWDGFTSNGNKVYKVPNGQYVIKLSVLKALGDDDNPAHWETWTSPVITLARP